jgi:hypothetical protein
MRADLDLNVQRAVINGTCASRFRAREGEFEEAFWLSDERDFDLVAQTRIERCRDSEKDGHGKNAERQLARNRCHGPPWTCGCSNKDNIPVEHTQNWHSGCWRC